MTGANVPRLEIEPLPSNRCLEPPDHHQSLNLCPLNRHEIPGPNRHYLTEFVCLPRLVRLAGGKGHFQQRTGAAGGDIRGAAPLDCAQPCCRFLQPGLLASDQDRPSPQAGSRRTLSGTEDGPWPESRPGGGVATLDGSKARKAAAGLHTVQGRDYDSFQGGRGVFSRQFLHQLGEIMLRSQWIRIPHCGLHSLLHPLAGNHTLPVAERLQPANNLHALAGNGAFGGAAVGRSCPKS